MRNSREERIIKYTIVSKSSQSLIRLILVICMLSTLSFNKNVLLLQCFAEESDVGDDSATEETTKLESEEDKFLMACSSGLEDDVATMLKEKPELAKVKTDDGETCLHLTAISGSVPIAKAVIAAGCDLNARATCEECLRMTPLSWLTYGGKYQLVEELLRAGADINLTFDGFEEGQLFTVMDVAKRFAEARQEDATDATIQDPFLNTLTILKAYGGKTYDELPIKDTPEKGNDEL